MLSSWLGGRQQTRTTSALFAFPLLLTPGSQPLCQRRAPYHPAPARTQHQRPPGCPASPERPEAPTRAQQPRDASPRPHSRQRCCSSGTGPKPLTPPVRSLRCVQQHRDTGAVHPCTQHTWTAWKTSPAQRPCTPACCPAAHHRQACFDFLPPSNLVQSSFNKPG